MGKRLVISMNMTIELQSDAEEAMGGVAYCPRCGWTKNYTNGDKAKRGLAAHSSHCKATGQPDTTIELDSMPALENPLMAYWNTLFADQHQPPAVASVHGSRRKVDE